jgi:hypothetical protein
VSEVEVVNRADVFLPLAVESIKVLAQSLVTLREADAPEVPVIAAVYDAIVDLANAVSTLTRPSWSVH